MSESLAFTAARGFLWGLTTVVAAGVVAFRLLCWPEASAIAPPLRGTPAVAFAPSLEAAPTLSGVIDLPPALIARARPGAVVFLTVRRPGSPEGPPLAAKRLPATRFPVAFTVQRDDSMLGTPLSEHLVVDARLDADGDAGTREPDEPRVHLEGIQPGSEVRLILR